jgi:hypothetical protein
MSKYSGFFDVFFACSQPDLGSMSIVEGNIDMFVRERLACFVSFECHVDQGQSY